MLISDIVTSRYGGVRNKAAEGFDKSAKQISRWVECEAAVVDGNVYVPVRRKALNLDALPPEERAKLKPLMHIPKDWVWFNERWYRKSHVVVPVDGSHLPDVVAAALDPSNTRNPRTPITPKLPESIQLSSGAVEALDTLKAALGVSTYSQAIDLLLGVTS